MPRTSCPEDAVAAPTSRRGFLQSASAAAFATITLPLPRWTAAAIDRLPTAVRIGVLTDLHHDVMHDGLARMEAFAASMSEQNPDAVLQLGDFAYPKAANRPVIDRFNAIHDRSLHVIGNHDLDAGHTRAQCLDVWGMPSPYYDTTVSDVNLVVLDGNDKGSPSHRGGYASYVGPAQTAWMKDRIAALEGPIVVVSHQPLAGPGAVDNAAELQQILAAASDKVILAINGHSHIDDVIRVAGIPFVHVNSASYYWVGGNHKHESYPADVHEKHPWVSHTCPYRDPLFTTLTIDPETRTIRLEGRRSDWVGPSPQDLGVTAAPGLAHGVQIIPEIRERRLSRAES
jgi:3',5'-cyclic-AMP phosphodiesterase